MTPIIAPSLLSADFTNLEREIKMLNNSKADWVHIDVMDGVFVPNITIGLPVISQIKKHSNKPLDVHLMITQPERYLSQFKNAGADILTVHFEASSHLHRTIDEIKSLGMKAGVSLNPHTPVHLLEDIIEYLDMVLIMSVNPGFGGQTFIESTYKKVNQAKELILKSDSKAIIEIDGGVDLSNAAQLIKAGASVLVSGNSIFKSKDPVITIQQFKNIII